MAAGGEIHPDDTLVRGIYRRDAAQVREAIAAGADVATIYDLRWRPFIADSPALAKAMRYSTAGIVRILLQAGAIFWDDDEADERFQTPLIYAFYNEERVAIISLILEHLRLVPEWSREQIRAIIDNAYTFGGTLVVDGRSKRIGTSLSLMSAVIEYECYDLFLVLMSYYDSPVLKFDGFFGPIKFNIVDSAVGLIARKILLNLGVSRERASGEEAFDAIMTFSFVPQLDTAENNQKYADVALGLYLNFAPSLSKSMALFLLRIIAVTLSPVTFLAFLRLALELVPDMFRELDGVVETKVGGKATPAERRNWSLLDDARTRMRQNPRDFTRVLRIDGIADGVFELTHPHGDALAMISFIRRMRYEDAPTVDYNLVCTLAWLTRRAAVVGCVIGVSAPPVSLPSAAVVAGVARARVTAGAASTRESIFSFLWRARSMTSAGAGSRVDVAASSGAGRSARP